jgi:parvulin-like peptidyl-prolyl isomerase
MSINRFLSLFLFVVAPFAMAVDVVSDGEVRISEDEFKAALGSMPPNLVRKAATDDGERFELINQMMILRKKAAAADEFLPSDDDYLKLKLRLLATKAAYVTEKEVGNYKLPDMQVLARERYDTQRDKYALVPERRASSHILLMSPAGVDREPARALAAELLQRVEAGADFSALVEEFSEDPGSKQRGGRLSRSIVFGDQDIAPTYSEALFSIDAVGGLSIAETQFGVHVIRLDGIEPSAYRSFEEVRGKILGDLLGEYRTLATLEVARRYSISEEAYIDDGALDRIFADMLQLNTQD